MRPAVEGMLAGDVMTTCRRLYLAPQPVYAQQAVHVATVHTAIDKINLAFLVYLLSLQTKAHPGSIAYQLVLGVSVKNHRND